MVDELVPLHARPQSDELFRQLLDTGPDALLVIDDRGRILLVNEQAERLFDYPREQLLGQPIEVLVPERFRRAHVGHRTHFVDAPKVRPMGSGLDLFGRRRDGSEFPIEISLSPLPTAQGMLASANVRDITERKQREQEVRHIQGHLLSAVEAIQGAFAIYDSTDRLVLCNSAYRAMLGQQVSGEVVGRTFEEILDVNLSTGTFDTGGRSLAELRASTLGYHRDPSGVLDVRQGDGRHIRVSERRTPEGGTVATIFDVTDDVRHEEELRRARRTAEAANSAKSEFLASMSHELRTPLNAILGFAQLLQRDKKEPLSDRHRERVDYVAKGGEHLLHLIDEVLDLSRVEAGRVLISPERVGLDDVLADVQVTLGPMAARAEVELLVVRPALGFAEVTADRTRFKQILMNFGSNAIKYGRRGGAVRLTAEVVDGMVRLVVRDDGIGIPLDKQPKIFQPFQRAGQETGPIEGTGIGLTISKRLAELMGGRVGFSSTPGHGSEFWLELPIHPTPPPPADDRAPLGVESSALASGEGPRHLVVYIEDNPSSIALMNALLADFDRVELVTAPTAEIGVEIVRARQPGAVIMDINLPGMSGFEATRRLAEWPETRHIPVIALSAAATVQDAARVKGAGFYRYLTKPVKVDELVEVLGTLLATAV